MLPGFSGRQESVPGNFLRRWVLTRKAASLAGDSGSELSFHPLLLEAYLERVRLLLTMGANMSGNTSPLGPRSTLRAILRTASPQANDRQPANASSGALR